MTQTRQNRSDSGREFEFTAGDFERVRNLIYKRAGIALAESKQEMVYSRLARRLRATGITSFVRYLDDLERGANDSEWEAFTNALTTNLTSFFREAHHFPILAEHVAKLKGPVEIWCSASSTGEEPYSIAITLCEAFGTLTPPAHIIATDIDTECLEYGGKRRLPDRSAGENVGGTRQAFFPQGQRGASRPGARASGVAQDDHIPATQFAGRSLAGQRAVRRDFLPQRDDLFR